MNLKRQVSWMLLFIYATGVWGFPIDSNQDEDLIFKLLELEGNDNDNAIEHPVRSDSVNKEVESTNIKNITTGSIKIPSTFLEPPPPESSIHLEDEGIKSSPSSEAITNQTTTIPPTSDDASSIKNLDVNQTTNAPAALEDVSPFSVSGNTESTSELPTTVSEQLTSNPEQLEKDDVLHSSTGEVISTPIDDGTLHENKEVLTTPISEDLALSSASNEKNNDPTVFLTTPSTESTMNFENDDTFATEEPQELRNPLEDVILKNNSTYTDSTTTDSIPISSTMPTEDEPSILTSKIPLKDVPISSETNHGLEHEASISTELPKLDEETTSQPEDIKPENSTDRLTNTELKEQPILNDGIISSVGDSQEQKDTTAASQSPFPNANTGLKETLSTLSDSHDVDEGSSEEESTESSTIMPTTNLPEDEQDTAILLTDPSEGKETQTEVTTHDYTDLTTSLLNLDEITSTPFPEKTTAEIILKDSDGSLKVSTSTTDSKLIIDISTTIPPKTIVIKEQELTADALDNSSVGHAPITTTEGSILANSTTSSSLHVSEHKENSTKKHVTHSFSTVTKTTTTV